MSQNGLEAPLDELIKQRCRGELVEGHFASTAKMIVFMRTHEAADEIFDEICDYAKDTCDFSCLIRKDSKFEAASGFACDIIVACAVSKVPRVSRKGHSVAAEPGSTRD